MVTAPCVPDHSACVTRGGVCVPGPGGRRPWRTKRVCSPIRAVWPRSRAMYRAGSAVWMTAWALCRSAMALSSPGGGRAVAPSLRVLSRQTVSVKSERIAHGTVYAHPVPKLWTQTLEEHRRAVHDATLDTTAALVHEHGLAAVTMSKIAAETGIGRATLYKYFPDVEA